ncbi:MAG: hypothetical protein M3O22_05320 [Pseudomonadota bacterium]|nr:hypothetical protein [Pseudomonadota bacterium]
MFFFRILLLAVLLTVGIDYVQDRYWPAGEGGVREGQPTARVDTPSVPPGPGVADVAVAPAPHVTRAGAAVQDPSGTRLSIGQAGPTAMTAVTDQASGMLTALESRIPATRYGIQGRVLGIVRGAIGEFRKVLRHAGANWFRPDGSVDIGAVMRPPPGRVSLPPTPPVTFPTPQKR